MSRSTNVVCQPVLAFFETAILLSLVASCGGTTGLTEDGSPGGSVASGGIGSGGSGGGDSGGNSATGGTGTGGEASGGAGGTSSGGASMGGSGGDPSQNPICNQPADTGPCDAALTRYAYDQQTGLCVPFSYGGCEGNENNFETSSACDEACRNGEPTPVDLCESPTQCMLEPNGCCGICEPAELESYRAINVTFLQTVRQQKEESCGNVACGACLPGESVRQNFGATCKPDPSGQGHCVAFDVRETPSVTGCSADEDCYLRNGLDCCDGCSDDAWVAVGDTAVLVDLVCGEEPLICSACAPMPPTDQKAACVDGTCQVVPQ